MTLNRIIKTILVSKGITQRKLAEKLGVSEVALYKKMNTDIPVSSLVKMAKALGYRVEITNGRNGYELNGEDEE